MNLNQRCNHIPAGQRIVDSVMPLRHAVTDIGRKIPRRLTARLVRALDRRLDQSVQMRAARMTVAIGAFHDDLHFLPFDGIADWQGIADRLVKCGFEGPLTFELKLRTTLNGCKLPVYGDITPEQYYTQAYIRACRVAALMEK